MTKMDTSFDITKIDWAKGDGLVPAIVQDARSLRVLMLGYVNKESLATTLKTGFVTFFSRSKQRLWRKGETSGHVLHLEDIKLDCDQDTLLIMAEPEGPTCHLGTQSCFGDGAVSGFATLADLAATIHARRHSPQAGSYTAKLFKEGVPRIAQKVGEEGVEVALAAQNGGERLVSEVADLVYHLSVLLEASELGWDDVMAILHERAQVKK
jgi:phosphoribosyl-ATP pyrophosphohydrolase/phosphoribosyl-AMP cyclohydrolase